LRHGSITHSRSRSVVVRHGSIWTLISARLPPIVRLRGAPIARRASERRPKTTTVDLGEEDLTKVDYGDGSTIQYLYAKDDYVIHDRRLSDIGLATQVGHLK